MKYAFTFLTTIFILFLFNSCKKTTYLETEQNPPLRLIETKLKVDSWIAQEKAFFSEEKKINIELLNKHLIISESKFENYKESKKILIIPINEEYRKQKNVQKNSELNLILILESTGEIESGNIVLFIPENDKITNTLPENTFSKILNKTVPNINGKFKFLSISGFFLFDIDYKNKQLKSFGKLKKSWDLNSKNVLDLNINCINWFLVTTYTFPDGSTYQTSEYVGTTCGGDSCYDPDLASICPEGEGGSSGNPNLNLEPNENIDGVDNICEGSFKFQQVITPINGLGGWRLAGTTDIHMQIVNTQTGQFIPLTLPTIYFGLPIYRANGDYYSESRAKEIAAEAVEYGEQKVMELYHSTGNLDLIGMTIYYRQKITEYMQDFGGSATLLPGSNINVTQLGKASYGWPIIGCL